MNNSNAVAERLEECFVAFPSRAIVVLYDEAIAALGNTIQAIEAGDIEARFFATSRVADVIAVLLDGLDFNEGGEIAKGLDVVYRTILTELPMINIRSDAALARRLIDILQPVRDAWAKLDDRIQSDVAMAEAMDAPRHRSEMRQKLRVVPTVAD
jgi:flagellar protein FliS